MSYRKDLQKSVEDIVQGAPIGAQIDKLLESKSGGWWPPPNSKWGRPLSDDHWTQLMLELLHLQTKNKSPVSILRQLATNWQLNTDVIKAFLKVTGLMGAFKEGTLDASAVMRVFDGAQRGSGVWTAGTKLSVIGKHHFEKSSGSDEAPLKELDPPGASISKKSMHHRMQRKWPEHLRLNRPKFWWRKNKKNDN